MWNILNICCYTCWSFDPANVFCSLLLSTLSRGRRKQHGKESRSTTPWQPFHLWGIIISLPTHVNSQCCFLFDSISIVTIDLLLVRGQSLLYNCLLMVLYQWQWSAVSSCIFCVWDEDKDNTVSTVLRDNNHWNRMSFSREMQIFIYMTDCIAVPVIVTVTTSPCSCSPS